MPGMGLQTAATPAYSGTVDIEGFTGPDSFNRCLVTVNGDTAKLSVYNEAKGRYTQHDILTSVKVDDRGRTVVLSGVSDTLVEEVGLKPADATVKWKVTVKGCATCG